MSQSRLSAAFESGAVSLPDTGDIAVFRPRAGADLSALPQDRVVVVQGFAPDFAAWEARGHRCTPTSPEEFAAAVVFLPRAKAEARALIAAAAVGGGPVVIDGQKTDGVDSLLRDVKRLAEVSAPLSKAHGKCFQISAPGDAFVDWALPPLQTLPDGWVTAPGVFSADGPDPASIALAAALPANLKGAVADLGAGWGYLSAEVLKRDGVTACHLVEAEHAALEAARANVTDPRARFVWADATLWGAPRSIDHVVMNPPFHTSRAADPALGAAFIATAARILRPSGSLWMVANRHLPYEAALRATFGDIRDLDTAPGFKLFHARKPLGPKRG